MPDWMLIPCLDRLRDDFDEVASARDRASDGTIGDTAHQNSVSDHNPDETGAVPIRDADRVNEVHGLDIDADLRTPGLTMEKVVQFLLGRCRSGAEKRLRYIIFNRRIWEASNGWRQKAYTGASPHTEHAHFSGSYDTKLEASTASWHLEDIAMPTAEDIAKAVWEYDADKATAGTQTAGGMLLTETRRSAATTNEQIPALAKAVAAVAAQLKEFTGRDLVDEPAIVAGLLAGLDPSAIAAAIPKELARQVADELATRLAG